MYIYLLYYKNTKQIQKTKIYTHITDFDFSNQNERHLQPEVNAAATAASRKRSQHFCGPSPFNHCSAGFVCNFSLEHSMQYKVADQVICAVIVTVHRLPAASRHTRSAHIVTMVQ